jgi:hypothetical protein
MWRGALAKLDQISCDLGNSRTQILIGTPPAVADVAVFVL